MNETFVYILKFINIKYKKQLCKHYLVNECKRAQKKFIIKI